MAKRSPLSKPDNDMDILELTRLMERLGQLLPDQAIVWDGYGLHTESMSTWRLHTCSDGIQSHLRPGVVCADCGQQG